MSNGVLSYGTAAHCTKCDVLFYRMFTLAYDQAEHKKTGCDGRVEHVDVLTSSDGKMSRVQVKEPEEHLTKMHTFSLGVDHTVCSKCGATYPTPDRSMQGCKNTYGGDAAVQALIGAAMKRGRAEGLREAAQLVEVTYQAVRRGEIRNMEDVAKALRSTTIMLSEFRNSAPGATPL